MIYTPWFCYIFKKIHWDLLFSYQSGFTLLKSEQLYDDLSVMKWFCMTGKNVIQIKYAQHVKINPENMVKT